MALLHLQRVLLQRLLPGLKTLMLVSLEYLLLVRSAPFLSLDLPTYLLPALKPMGKLGQLLFQVPQLFLLLALKLTGNLALSR